MKGPMASFNFMRTINVMLHSCADLPSILILISVDMDLNGFSSSGVLLRRDDFELCEERKRSGRVRTRLYSLPFTVSERHDAVGRRLSPSMKLEANVKHIVSICTSYIQIIFWSRSANFRLVFPFANCSSHHCSYDHVCSHEYLDADASVHLMSIF